MAFTHVDLTYKLENYPSHTPLSNDQIDSAIRGAFAKWQVVSPFTFSKITSGTADITLSFGTVTGDDTGAEASAAAHTIVFDDRRTWLDIADELRAKNITTSALGLGPVAILLRGIWDEIDLDKNRLDVLSIAVHEIGHVLGLGHNPTPASVMQPVATYYKMINVNGAPISQVDIDAL
jgi:predicted Zn-dependent protease